MNIRPYNPNNKQEFKAGDYAIEQIEGFFWSGIWIAEKKFSWLELKNKPTGNILFKRIKLCLSIERARNHIYNMQRYGESVESKPIYHKP